MPQRWHPAVTEHQVQRQGEKTRNQDLADQDQIPGEQKIAGDHERPERNLGGPPAAARRKQSEWFERFEGDHRHVVALPNSPWGCQNRIKAAMAKMVKAPASGT